MRKILPLCFLVFAFKTGIAQKSFEIGVSTGITNYYGDLGNQEFYQAGSTRPGLGITVRNFIKPKAVSGQQYRALNYEAKVAWYRLGYDETKPIGNAEGFELRNYGRGLSFRTDLFSVEGHITYTLYPNIRQPLHVQKTAMYFYTGLGVYYGKPKADLFRGSIDISNRYYFWKDGTIRDADESTGHGNIIEKDGKYETNLADWKTEGSGYSTEFGKGTPNCFYNLGIPIGAGIRYGLNRQLTLSIDFTYYHLFCDNIDDVSSRYAYESEIETNFPGDPAKQQLAAYISDPTGYGTDGHAGPQTSPRGNPSKKDSFSFLNVELAYRFEFIPKKIFGMK